MQASVESEEVAWKKRLSDKEKDLHQLVADKANLQLQIKQLEDTIDKVKQAEDVSDIFILYYILSPSVHHQAVHTFLYYFVTLLI